MNSKFHSPATSNSGSHIPFYQTNSFLAAIIILLAALIYLPLFNAGFIWYDDDIMVFNNALITSLNPDTFIRSFSFENIVHYHPLVYISYLLERSLFGLDPSYFHLTNIILHCINSVLIFFMFRELKTEKITAFTAAVLFSIHPLHVESVAWISERKDMLYSLFYISSLILYIRFRNSDNRRYYYYSIVMFTLSCLSKSMAVTLPFILIAVDHFFIVNKKLSYKNKIPYILISAVFAVINLFTAFYKTDISGYTIFQKLSFIFYAVLFYPFKMLLPYDLSVIYIYPAEVTFIYIISPIIFISIIFFIYRLKTRSRTIKFGLWFYIITIIPVLPIVPFGISITADRYSYLPLAGLFIVIAVLIRKVIRNVKNNIIPYKAVIASSCIIIIVILSVISYYRVKLWNNTETLMQDAVSKNNSNYYAEFILGNYYAANNRYAEAIIRYQSSIKINGKYADAYFNLGNVFVNAGYTEDAIKAYIKAVELDPNDKLAFNNLGVVYEQTGRNKEAIECYKRSAELGHFPAKEVLKYYGYY